MDRNSEIFRCVSCNEFKTAFEGEVVYVFIPIGEMKTITGEKGIMNKEKICRHCVDKKGQKFIIFEHY